MKRIGFLTSNEFPDLIDDDRLVLVPLERKGIHAVPVVWDRDPDLTLDAYVFRSCWDYHRKPNEFGEFLQRLGQTGKPVFNSLDTIRWNYHKKYLKELAKAGVHIPKTFSIRAGDSPPLGELDAFLFQFKAGTRVVVKPAISMSGHDTFLFEAADRKEILDVLNSLNDRDLLLQEFISEIEDHGEVSLIFFNGKFSHALRKRAAQGEFRVQHEYGGSRDLFQPSRLLRENAERVLKCRSENFLYARVDGVERGGELILIELEVIDPMIYFHLDDEAPERFASAVAERL